MNDKSVQTIADIARLAGVSKSTVSRALSGSPLVNEETRERCCAIAAEHNFQINNAARSLSMKQSHTLALVAHAYHHKECYSVTDLFLLELMGAISGALSANRYDLLLASVDPYDTQWPHQYLDTGRVDGFILMTSTRKQFHIKTLVEMKAPFIVWGTPLPGFSYCSVTGDNLMGGRLATEHLLRSGRRRIAFVGGPANEFEVQKRYEGYESVLREAGYKIDPELVSYGEFSGPSSAERVAKLLKKSVTFDAVLTNSDLMAISAINVLQENGRRVPEDVSVIGYDDLSIAQHNSPSLTTVRQNLPLVGKLLAKNLVDYIQTGIVTNVTVPAELVIRKSA
jgi:DNA-binding LacI/PurR family transcriptional regulator